MTASARRASHRRPTSAPKDPALRDDLKLIDAMILRRGQIELADLARGKGVSFAAASRVLARLRRERLVLTFPYHMIFLTQRGRAIARAS